jgi:diguanylate cyclase (GGDEF)-like protein
MIVLFAFFVFWPLTRYDGPTLAEASFPEAVTFSEDWTLADGTIVNPDKLNKTDGVKAYEEVSIYHALPEKLAEGTSLCFRSKNIFLKVFVDGTLVYEPYYSQSAVYTNSYGTNWHYVSLPSSAAGKEIEIRYYRVYESARACIDNLYLGQSAGVMLGTWKERMVALITCVLLLFVGILLIVADIPINMGTQKNHQLRYLGLFALSISVWCLSETNMMQFFIGDNRAMQVVSCGSLMMITIPTMLYLEAAFGLRHKWLIPVICISSVLEFFVCWILQFLKIADIHDTMACSHVLLAVTAIILFVSIFRNTFLIHRADGKKVYRVLRTVGLSSISFATIVDIVRYYVGNGSDSAMFVRIGLLIFIICFGVSSLEKTINAVQLAARSEIVSQLAYKDGLTQIGNRTAFGERLEALENQKEESAPIGIVMFDVNNLKYVNDHLGHSVGDAMIVKSAEIIRDSFATATEDCYRIGGDEFSVILSGGDVEADYQLGIERFTAMMVQYNAEPDKEYDLSIARGFAVYRQTDDGEKSLQDIFQLADSRMYENKKAIKAQLNQTTG